MQTHLSSKGQVVIPQAIRKAMKLPVGTRFEVVQQDEDILLKRTARKEGLSMDELLKRMHEISAPYRPEKPVPIEEISQVSEEALAEYYKDRI